jgi:hypothetical protein
MIQKSLIILIVYCLFNFNLNAQVDQPAIKDTVNAINRLKHKDIESIKTDSTRVVPPVEKEEKQKSILLKEKKEDAPYVHSPKKASFYSALLPGAGQYYNKKYWKIPVLYAGFGALGYSVGFNQRLYREFKDELIKRQQNLGGLDPDLERYSDSNLNELQDFYRRNRDLSYIGIALFYIINIVDATVDAHLFEFDMSDDLSMRIGSNENDIIAFRNFQPRLQLTFKF